MRVNKSKSIWPLPDGVTSYVKTLTKILRRIRDTNPTYEELLIWFKSEFNLGGKKTPIKYLKCIEPLEFFNKRDDKLCLTEESLKFLETKDHKIVYSLLDRSVLGFDDILSKPTILSVAPLTAALTAFCPTLKASSTSTFDAK